jgi:hypothetical protein
MRWASMTLMLRCLLPSSRRWYDPQTVAALTT